jgi:hypothetical protein
MNDDNGKLGMAEGGRLVFHYSMDNVPSRPSLQDNIASRQSVKTTGKQHDCFTPKTGIPSQFHAVMFRIQFPAILRFIMPDFLLSRHFKILYHVKNHQYLSYDKTQQIFGLGR